MALDPNKSIASKDVSMTYLDGGEGGMMPDGGEGGFFMAGSLEAASDTPTQGAVRRAAFDMTR